jgi:SAM-dependent methyltransferase
MVHLQELAQAQDGLKKQQSVISDARAARMLHGMSQNLCLIERFIKPIEDYLRGSKTSTSSLLDWALAQNVGSVAQIMLPFFYQDWAGIKDFEEAEILITSALNEHRPDDETAAILGTGACGIAYASAKYFQEVYGIDLSVPTLLLAQAFLSGHALEIHLSQAGWQSVKVSPPAPSKNEIRLVAADVGTLPFAKGSLSAVVTQYLMDIVGDPLGIATEIQRVLKPNGIWVNFSNPFRLPEDPPEFPLPEPSELAELLKPCGLEMIKAERQRFTLLNLDPIYAGGHRKLQEVHFFVARKPHSQGIVTHRRFQIWDKHDDSWWEHIPKIIRGREIQIIQKKILGPEGIREQMEIGLNAVNFGVSREHTAFAEVIFSHIDGKHTLRDIQNHLASQGITMSETEFRELIYCLLNQYCVISLDHLVVA